MIHKRIKISRDHSQLRGMGLFLLQLPFTFLSKQRNEKKKNYHVLVLLFIIYLSIYLFSFL